MVPSESPNSAPSLVFMPLMIALCIIISVVLALLALQSIIIRVCMREQHERPQETRRSCMVGGVNKRALEAIPVYAYSTKNDEEQECSVCLGELEEGESVRALPNCGHVFHCSCIDAWLVQHSTCPFCRSRVPIVEPLVVSVNQDGSINGDHDHAAGFSLAMVREKLRIKGALCLSCLTLFSFNDVVVENSEYSSSNV